MGAIEIKCNGCGTLHTFPPSPVAQSIQCPTCQWTVTAPAASAAPMARPLGAQPPSPHAATVDLPPAAAPFARPIGTGATTPLPATVVPPHLAQHAASPQINHAVPPESRATVTGEQDTDSEQENPQGSTGPSAVRALLPTIFIVMLLLLIVGGGFALYLAYPDLFNSADKNRGSEVDEDDNPLTITNDGATWADASRNVAQKINGVKVGIEDIEYGEVYAKDAANTVQASGQLFLQIHLHLENTTANDVLYRSWYGNVFGGRVAKLTDNTGRVYDMMTFGDVTRIRGHTPEATLKTTNQLNDRKFADDVLIYEVAEGVDINNVKYFRLELPAAAHGGNGTYRFQIPRSRLADEQPLDES